MRVASSLLAVACAATAGVAQAHADHAEQGPPASLADAWTLSPWLLVPLAGLVLAWTVGLVRLWSRAGIGRGVSTAEAGAFAAGIAALLLATVWPLDAYGEWSLAAHMAQHMMLLALAPPLLLAGRPFAVLATAAPAAWSQRLARTFARPVDAMLLAVAPATALHMGVMVAWHLPAALALALASDPVHWAMHASFLLAGLWFWAALWRCVRERDTGAWAGVVALVAVMMLMGLMGGLLTFSPRVLYAVYALRAPQLALDPLQDQALAGLLMWVPACLPYLGGAVLLTVRGLRRFAPPRL